MQQRNMYQAKLLDRYLQGIATPEETAELFAWLKENSPESIGRLEEIIEKNYAEAFAESPGLSAPESQRILTNLLRRMGKKAHARKIRTVWYRAAAAVVLLALGAVLYFLFPGKTRQPAGTAKALRDVQAPRSSRAIITLANGNKILLDSAVNGQLALQGNVKLIKLATRQIVYQGSNLMDESSTPSYNTLTNPRGSQVTDMTLSDGSRVWLNAGSSITYPIAFTGKERKVSITGEAYFEVTRDIARPFYVMKGDMEVKVLGTHFNVNTYEEEGDMKVTLLEGAVRVANTIGSVMIKPGEQARLASNRQPVTSNRVNMEQVMAWKNGLFNFEEMSLKEAMLQLERWYDIRVEYEAGMPNVPLFGKIDRDLSLADLLDILRGAGFRFRLEEGGKLVLMK